ncbi:MAG TPA: metal-dependent hydrolase [Candidatus Saccharimonadia bacterium]|nr:metal-dependent hydrolase [Candidatus Saccharimonadia bacterium]
MTARTHDLAAITALGAVIFLEPLRSFTVGTALMALLFNQIGGILPDIDQPTAPLWRDLPVGGIIGRVIDKTLGGHRFITHSILGLALFGFLTHLLLTFLHPIIPKVDVGYVWWAFMIGMVSHLVMDTLTKEGVPWLLPLPIKFGLPPLKEFRITTGKAVETWIVFPAILAVDIVFCATHYRVLVLFVHGHLI